jgi:predicted transcriptional regulator
MVAPNYAQRRSQLAMSMGLGKSSSKTTKGKFS